MRFTLSAVAGISGLLLLGLAFYGQPALYLHQAREQWNSLLDNPPGEEQADQDRDAAAGRVAALQQQVKQLENQLVVSELEAKRAPVAQPAVPQPATPQAATPQPAPPQAIAAVVASPPPVTPPPAALQSVTPPPVTPQVVARAPVEAALPQQRAPASEPVRAEAPRTAPDTSAAQARSPDQTGGRVAQAAESPLPAVPVRHESVGSAATSPEPVPPKVEQPKVEQPKAGQLQMALPKPEVPKSETGKFETGKFETGKFETGKFEPPKTAAPDTEPAKVDPARSGPVRTEVVRVDPTKGAPPKSDLPKPPPQRFALLKAVPAPPPLPQAASPGENDADTQSVLARLRQLAPGRQADVLPPVEPRPRPAPSPTVPGLNAARAALASGRIEDARRLLQQAQLQLVFRPMNAEGEDSPAATQGAADVAHALDALSSNDVPLSRRYIDVAVGDLSGSGTNSPVQQSQLRTTGYAPAYPPR